MTTPLEIVLFGNTGAVAFASKTTTRSGLAETLRHHVFGPVAKKRVSTLSFLDAS